MPQATAKNYALITFVITFFLDFTGLFMVVPIFAPLLLDPHSALLAPEVSNTARTIIIGSLVAIYGIGQLIGGPLLGELSDQFGRKKILCLGLIILVIGNLIGGLGLLWQHLSWLFLCRLLTGFASGNGSVLFAAISNLSCDDTERGINLGYLTGAAAVGAVVGPLIGARLSHSAYFPWFTWATPFLAMSVIFLLNIILVLVSYHDTEHYQRRKLNLLIGFNNLFECLTTPHLRVMLLAFFLFSISTESIFAGLPIFAVQKFHVTSVWLGNLIAWGSLISAFSSFYLNKKLSKVLNSYWLSFITLALLCIAYVSFFLPLGASGLFFSYGLFGLTCILTWTHNNAVIANSVATDVQGKVLGVTQSLLSLAIIIGPGIVGLVASVHYNIVIILPLLSALLSLIVFVLFWRRASK